MPTSIEWPIWSIDQAPADLARYVVPEVVRQCGGAGDAGPGGATERLEGLWERLRAVKIGYAGAKVDEDGQQLIRPPAEVLTTPKSGTCLDLALMLAGAAESTGLPVAVIVLDPVEGSVRHALVAVSLKPEPPWPTDGKAWLEAPDGFLDEVRDDFKVPSGSMVVLDPVGLTRVPISAQVTGANATLEAAVKHGHSFLASGSWVWRLGVAAATTERRFVPARVPKLLPLRTDLYRTADTAESALRLLRPEYRLTPFQARSELTVLEDFCEQIEHGSTTGVAVVTGVGGAGKTRLGLRLCELLQARGWYAGPLIEQPRSDEEPPGGELPGKSIRWLTSVTAPLLVMIDYADARIAATQQVLRALQQRSGPPAVVLLTGRSLSGDWLDEILGNETANGHPIRHETLELEAAHPQQQRIYYGTVQGIRSLPDADTADNDEVEKLSAPAVGVRWTTLDLVLLAWLAAQGKDLPATQAELYDDVLLHEGRYWQRSCKSAGFATDLPLLHQAVACLTLLGPIGVDAASRALQRLPSLAEDRPWRRGLALGLLTCLEPGPGERVALRPDPVGDHHLLRTLSGDRKLLTKLLPKKTKPKNLVEALLILNRAGQQSMDRATAQVVELLRAKPVRWSLVAEVGTALSGPCQASLETLVGERDTPLPLEEISKWLPFQATGLWRLALQVDERLLLDERGGDPEKVAARLLRVSNRRGLAGDWAGSLGAVEEAVGHYRVLVEANPAAFTPDLAASLNNLSVQRSDAGDRPGALQAIEEAVGHYRVLVEANPAAFTPKLAMSLNNLSLRLSEAGNRPGALAAIKEAVAHYRVLAEANPAVFVPDLAMSLNNLSLRLSEAGDRQGALAAIKEAVAHYRVLAEANPAVFVPDLAMSLNNLSIHRAEAGDRPGALQAVEEAVAHYRVLAEANPAVFVPDLATALNNLSVHRSGAGDWAGALDAGEKAVGYFRVLAEASSAAFIPDLAKSLDNLSLRLSEAGDRARALAAIEEAAAHYQVLMETNPAAFTPDLAMSLSNLSTHRSASGDRTGALQAIEDSVGHYRVLAEANPAAFFSALAAVLNNLSVQRAEMGDRPGALQAVEESVGHYRVLAEANPAVFVPGLAGSLNNLSIHRAEAGDRPGALQAVEEAVGLYRVLVEANPAVFTPDLAASLNNLSNRLSDAGDRQGALQAVEESVGHYRVLVEANPAVFVPDLAMALNNLSVQRSDAGDRQGALHAIEEAVGHYRVLVEANPAAFTPNLATSLNNLSNRLSDAGDRPGALQAVEEAVALRRVLVEANPAVFVPDLATSLNNLSNRLSDAGDRQGALQAVEEAVGHYRVLVEANPAAFIPNLATSLNNLSNRLSDAGDRRGALQAVEEAVGHYRVLVEANPAVFVPDLAGSLNNLSLRRSEAGDRAGALQAIEEAVALRRMLVEANPVAFTRDLAGSTRLLADLRAATDDLPAGSGEWARSGAAVPITPLRSWLTADAASWHADHGEHVGAAELIADACREAEAEPEPGDRAPLSLPAETRLHVRAQAIQLSTTIPNLVEELPTWAIHSIDESHYALVKACVGVDLTGCATAVGDAREVFLCDGFRSSLETIAFLHSNQPGPIGLLRKIRDSADTHGLDAVLTHLRGVQSRHTLISTWIGLETWRATFDYLRDHHAELSESAAIDLLESDDDPLARQHAAILRLVGEDPDNIDAVAGLVTDPQLAVDSALSAIDQSALATLLLIVQAQPAILRSDATLLIVAVLHLAAGQMDEAIATARGAHKLTQTTRRAHLVHLRRYQANAAPLLPAEGAAALAEVIAAYGEGL